MGRTVYLPTLKTHKNQRTNLGKYIPWLLWVFQIEGVFSGFIEGLLRVHITLKTVPQKKNYLLGGTYDRYKWSYITPLNGGERKTTKNGENNKL